MSLEAKTLHRYLKGFKDKSRLDKPFFRWIEEGQTGDERLQRLRLWLDNVSGSLGLELGQFLTSPHIADFFAQLATAEGGDSVLDPACGAGLVLSSAGQAIEATTIVGIEVVRPIAEVAKLIAPDKAEIIHADSLSGEDLADKEFDLIVAEAPFGSKLRDKFAPFEGEDLQIRQLGYAMVGKWVQRLSHRGRGMFLLPVSCLSQQSKGLWGELADQGFHVRAMIHVPAGNLRSVRLECYMVVIDRVLRDKIFTGQFSRDAQHQQQLIENYLAHREGSRLGLGRLVELEPFRGFKAVDAEEQLLMVSRKARLNAVPIGELLDDCKTVNRSRDDLADGENVVFLPYHGRFDAFLNAEDAPEWETVPILRLAFKPELVSARYMVDAFNDDSGRLFLESVSHAASSLTVINKEAFLGGKFYIPDKEVQNRILDTKSKIIALKAELEDLDSQIRGQPTQIERLSQQVDKVNHENTLESWLEELPFPIASILWRYCATAGQSKDRNETLLHFFEALGGFWATLYLSAAKSDADFWADHVNPLNKALSRVNLTFERATFGLWKCVVEYFRKQFNSLLKSNSGEDRERCARMFATNSSDVLEMLVDSKVITVLQKSNAIRNSKAHGGVMGQAGIIETHRELMDLVQACRGFMGSNWARYQLVQPESPRFTNGQWHYEVRLIMGTRTPFAHAERVTDRGMEHERLHLLDADARQSLMLLPLVRVMPSPQTASNACYFYNKSESGNQHFVSYHFDAESHIEQTFEDTIAAIEGLKPFGDTGNPLLPG